jgi:hypothetical protein
MISRRSYPIHLLPRAAMFADGSWVMGPSANQDAVPKVSKISSFSVGYAVGRGRSQTTGSCVRAQKHPFWYSFGRKVVDGLGCLRV